MQNTESQKSSFHLQKLFTAPPFFKGEKSKLFTCFYSSLDCIQSAWKDNVISGEECFYGNVLFFQLVTVWNFYKMQLQKNTQKKCWHSSNAWDSSIWKKVSSYLEFYSAKLFRWTFPRWEILVRSQTKGWTHKVLHKRIILTSIVHWSTTDKRYWHINDMLSIWLKKSINEKEWINNLFTNS